MPLQRSTTNSELGRLAPGVRLAAYLAAIALCWLVVLPLVATSPRVRADIERNDSLGIDPSVKFYSELPAMPRIVERVEEIRRRKGGAFW